MRKLFLLLSSILLIEQASFAQLTGTKNIPGDYPDLSSAISALNTFGVGAGGVTLNLIAGNPQTAPAGGYVIGNTGSAILGTTSSTKQITIEGNNNVITAFSPQASGTTNDAVFKIIGADWITIRNCTIQENAANTITTIAGNNMTEWGVALLYASAIKGAQNNTIRNNTITLDRNYQNSIGVYSSTRHTANATATIADITNFTGSNSYNKVYTNAINNVSEGIVFISSLTPSLMNLENELGGNSSGLGNTITNWGHNSGPASFVDVDNTTIAGIYENNERMVDIMNNTIISANLNSPNPIYGLLLRYSSSIDATNSVPEVWFNTITLTQGGSGDIIGTATLSTTTAKAYTTLWVTNNYFYNNAITGLNSSANMIGVMNTSFGEMMNIYDHKIKNNTSTATTGGFTGMYNTGNSWSLTFAGQMGTASENAVTFSFPTTAPIYGIRNEAASSLYVVFSATTMQRFSFVQTGPFYGIYNSAPVNGTGLRYALISFGSATNQLATYSGTQTSDFNYIYNTNGPDQPLTPTYLLINDNYFKGVNFINPSSSNVKFIYNTAPIFASLDINNNTFNNITLNTSGDVRFISSSSIVNTVGTRTQNFNNNSIVTGFTKTQSGVGGMVKFIEILGADHGTPTINVKDNIISNVSVSGSSFWGINNQNGAVAAVVGPHIFIQNNTLSNILLGTSEFTAISSEEPGDVVISGNALSGLAKSGGSIKGIAVSGTTSPSFIRSNNINTFTTADVATLTGIHISANYNTMVISKNKIYNFEGTGAGSNCIGISFNGPGAGIIENNLVGDLRTPNAVSPNSINGIFLGGGTMVSLFYNTVWINGSSSSSLFGSSAVDIAYNSSIGPYDATFRNNIFVNLSTPKGTGVTVSHRRESINLADYNSSSDNNLFYAGTPGPSNLIFYNGVNSDQTLAAYKTRVSPRDAASITENPNFISTSGSNANFLHIVTSIPTAIDGGALPVTGYTTDYDNQVRNASTPDIGADEFSFAPPTCSQPTGVSITNIAATTATVNFTSPGSNFIVEYGVSGFTPGTAGTAGVGGTIVTGTSSPVNLTGLNSSTTYQVYVRQVCTSPPYSSNTSVASFSTLHMFDEASTAGLLTVGAGCTGAPYNTTGATASSLEKYPSCSGTRQAPIWFKFVAPASGAVRITTDLGTPTLTNSKIALFSATNVNDYNTFTVLSCDDNGGSVIGSGFLSVLYATSLAPGNTYYIAVDKYNSSTTTGTFCIAVDELDNSMLSTNTACATSYQVPEANSNTTYSGWVPLLDASSKLIAMVRNPVGGAANSYTLASQNINTNPVRSSNGTYYLDRNYLINSTATNVQVKFFFLTSELTSLMTADPSVTAANIGATKQGGNTCTADFSPLNGWTNFLTQNSNGISADGLVRWIEVTTPSFSNFFLKGALGGALPTNMVSFSGEKEGTINKLRWTTATESNNLGFEVQRSTDGTNYTAIGFVNSQAIGGNSSDILNYTFTDNNPVGVKQYYRLRQVDIDNRSKFSSIVLIRSEKISLFTIAGIFPNPANSKINIMLEAPVKDNVTIMMIDGLGRSVLQKVVNAGMGSNTIAIDISTLAKGSYFIKAICSANCETAIGKFVKQ